MKKNLVVAICALALMDISAQASFTALQNCASDIVTEVFTSCPGGEGGANTVCGSTTKKWGSIVADMTVDQAKKSATAHLVYTSVSGEVIRSKTSCSLGSDNWMNCVSAKQIPTLGHLTISYNIDGISPGVYFADIYADATNVPVGGFQNTDIACKK